MQKLANKVTSYRVKPQTQQIHWSSMKKPECNMEKYCPIKIIFCPRRGHKGLENITVTVKLAADSLCFSVEHGQQINNLTTVIFALAIIQISDILVCRTVQWLCHIYLPISE